MTYRAFLRGCRLQNVLTYTNNFTMFQIRFSILQLTSMIELQTYKGHFVRLWSALPKLAASSASSCSPTGGSHYNLRSKRRKRPQKASYGHTGWCSLRTMLNPVVILLPSSLAFHHDIYWMYAQFSRSSKFCLLCSSILHSVDTSHISVIPLCFLCVLPLLLSPFCSVCSLRGWLWWTIRTVPIHSYNSFIGLVL